REVTNRFDFKATGATFTLEDGAVNLKAQVDFQLGQMLDVLRAKLAKREVDVGCLGVEDPVVNVSEARQRIVIRQGLDQPLAKRLVKLIKDQKLKVQASIQGDKLRVSGKKRDDLQEVISLVKRAEVDLPLQYINFRD
ncbi:MAG: YajQ family cyclic di-GMP-binding protein, partial [Gammaproteobacteria bacterium]|nr:YajQ family cyclic di-GMP-binding protein [Gammaproteobacteria bacterium]